MFIRNAKAYNDDMDGNFGVWQLHIYIYLMDDLLQLLFLHSAREFLHTI